MSIFYCSAIESILSYGITSWFSNLAVKYKCEILNLVKTAGKIMGSTAPLTPQDLFELATIRQTIISDSTHALFPEFSLMNSGRRYRVPLCKHNRLKHSFVPTSIRLINEQLEGGGKGRAWKQSFLNGYECMNTTFVSVFFLNDVCFQLTHCTSCWWLTVCVFIFDGISSMALLRNPNCSHGRLIKITLTLTYNVITTGGNR